MSRLFLASQAGLVVLVVQLQPINHLAAVAVPIQEMMAVAVVLGKIPLYMHLAEVRLVAVVVLVIRLMVVLVVHTTALCGVAWPAVLVLMDI
jgi:hypothetical protein